MKNALGRGWWTLERFGLSPAKLGRRLTTRDGPRVFCITVPKAGTHLLERALCLHPALARKLLRTVRSNNVAKLGGLEGIARGLRRGQVAMSHLHHTPDHAEILSREGLVTIFLVRDPRDIVVSEAVYLASGDRRHRLHPMFASQPDAKERILLLLRGDSEHGVVAMGRKLERYAGWLDSGALVVRFEDLVGSSGGGDDERQRAALRSIFAHLGLPEEDIDIRSLAAHLFSAKSPTFHRGAIGQWRQQFDPEIEAAFRESVGDAMARYGYPDPS